MVIIETLVTFVVDTENKEDALSEVESVLHDVANDWSELRVL